MARQTPLSTIKRYRWKELGLFIIPFMIFLLAMTQLLLARSVRAGLVPTSSLSAKNLPTVEGLIPVLGIIAILLGVNVLLSFTFPKADQVLLPLVGLLSGIGVMMALRIGPNLFPPDPALGTRQLMWVIVGIAAFLITLFGLRRIEWLRNTYYLWAILGIVMVGITLGRSLRANLDSPTHDQLNIGPLNLQPSELLKIFFLGLIGYKLFSYVRLRFDILGINVLNWTGQSENIYQNKGGFQIIQGLIALANGGIIGTGIGLGHPTFVPVVQSDMIFTALGEELGLAGLFAIIGIYLLIIYRGYRIAIQARDSFNQLLAAGLTSIFAIQTLIITAGNMKFLPLTGIPLPFLSYGGSSILANYIIIGILLRISHNTAMEREGLA